MSDRDEFLKAFQIAIEMFKSISNSIAVQNKITLELIEDLRRYRAEREKKELLNTDQKIEAAIKKNSFLTYFVDRVLPAIIIAVVLWIMKEF